MDSQNSIHRALLILCPTRAEVMLIAARGGNVNDNSFWEARVINNGCQLILADVMMGNAHRPTRLSQNSFVEGQ